MPGNFEAMLASREQLIQIEKGNYSNAVSTKKRTTKTSKLGCENCPSNKQDGVNKLFTKMRGRKLVVFAQNPNIDENAEKKALIGKVAKWFWTELEKAGLSRADCDIQYAVRCLPVTDDDEVRPPSNQEIRCCSIHTERALEESQAKVYIILGAVAARQVCGTEYRKDQRIFWSENLKAKVYCLDHPASFMYSSGKNVARVAAFRESLAAAVADVKGKKIRRYSFLETQDYKGIFTVSAAKKEARRIYEAAKRGIRVSMDSEDFPIDGKRVPLVWGTCFKKGRSRVFVLDHPKAIKRDGKWQPLPPKVRRKIKSIVRWMIENPTIRIAMHHGSSDTLVSKALLDARMRGYDFDTEYAAYFDNPDAKSYGLSALATRHHPQFVGYKVITMPEAAPDPESLNEKQQKVLKLPLAKQFDYFRKRNLLNYAKIPIHKMIMYNGADCDLTKREEIRTRKNIPKELLKIYIDDAFILDEMEKNGPVHDNKHSNRLMRFYPPKAEKLLEELQAIAGKVNKLQVTRYKTPEKVAKFTDEQKEKLKKTVIEFNPGSPDQVKYVIFKRLKIEFPQQLLRKRGSKINTQKGSLEVMAQEHKFPKLLLAYRKVSKICSQYLKGYRACADNNDGKLRTKWWLTGTGTGRLSSGGGKEKEFDTLKIVNLQNVHGDRNLKNLLVPQKNWRDLYNALQSAVERVVGKIKIKFKEKIIARLAKSKLWRLECKKILKRFGDYKVFLGYDFGQIEVRVMAQISDDEVLISDCLSGDIHSAVGHRMTGWAVHKIKKDKKTRTLTKNIHFGILFGLAAEGVYVFIKMKDPDNPITPELAVKYHQAYFNVYKGVARYVKHIRAFVEKHGYVENLFGFKRVLIENNEFSFDDSDTEEGFEESIKKGAYWGNQALNTPVQGAAHQLMLMALSALKRKPKKYKILGVPTMEVHDALYNFVKLRNLLKGFVLGKQLLEKEPLAVVRKRFSHIKWKVPLAVEGESGLRLGDTIEAEDVDGNMKSIEEILAAMTLETYESESKLLHELKLAA